jgi:hypothetical protein
MSQVASKTVRNPRRCEMCGKELRRKISPFGVLENKYDFERRRTCSKSCATHLHWRDNPERRLKTVITTKPNVRITPDDIRQRMAECRNEWAASMRHKPKDTTARYGESKEQLASQREVESYLKSWKHFRQRMAQGG